jgi:hypothetical protein
VLGGAEQGQLVLEHPVLEAAQAVDSKSRPISLPLVGQMSCLSGVVSFTSSALRMISPKPGSWLHPRMKTFSKQPKLTVSDALNASHGRHPLFSKHALSMPSNLPT